MNTNLEQLKQLKAEGKKEFPFLTPVSEYISKNYGEIENELEEAHLLEILGEIRGLDSLKSVSNEFAAHVSPDELIFTGHPSINPIKSDDPAGMDKNKAYISRGWRNSIEVSFNELFYISDVAGYDAYLEANFVEEQEKDFKRQEERIVKQKEEEKQRQEDVVEASRLREKFGIERGGSVQNAILFEQLHEGKDVKAKFKAFVELQDTDNSSYNRIYNIAEEAFRDNY